MRNSSYSATSCMKLHSYDHSTATASRRSNRTYFPPASGLRHNRSWLAGRVQIAAKQMKKFLGQRLVFVIIISTPNTQPHSWPSRINPYASHPFPSQTIDLLRSATHRHLPRHFTQVYTPNLPFPSLLSPAPTTQKPKGYTQCLPLFFSFSFSHSINILEPAHMAIPAVISSTPASLNVLPPRIGPPSSHIPLTKPRTLRPIERTPFMGRVNPDLTELEIDGVAIVARLDR